MGGLFQRLPSVSPVAARLDAARAARLDAVLSAHAAARHGCEEALASLHQRGVSGVLPALDAAASEVLAALRDPAEERSLALRVAARVDAAVRTSGVELLDTRWVPEPARRISYAMLDGFNRRSGAYAAWRDLVVGALGDGTRLYDLAAGNGGFCRWLAASPLPGRRLSLTSSDLDEGNVHHGRTLAQRAGLDVCFEVRDALDLGPLAGEVDLFVCTQAFHHLSPGLVVGVLAAAIRAAPRGILVIDLLRSAANVLAAPAVVGLLAPFPIVVIDGVISVRRAYAPVELAALARLAGATNARTSLVGPAHVALRARSI